MNLRQGTLRPLWWLLIGFVAAVFFALPAAMIGYAVGGAIIGGIAVLGTLILIQLPIMLLHCEGRPLLLENHPTTPPSQCP
jgi:hypothetical protein